MDFVKKLSYSYSTISTSVILFIRANTTIIASIFVGYYKFSYLLVQFDESFQIFLVVLPSFVFL